MAKRRTRAEREEAEAQALAHPEPDEAVPAAELRGPGDEATVQVHTADVCAKLRELGCSSTAANVELRFGELQVEGRFPAMRAYLIDQGLAPEIVDQVVA